MRTRVPTFTLLSLLIATAGAVQASTTLTLDKAFVEANQRPSDH